MRRYLLLATVLLWMTASADAAIVPPEGRPAHGYWAHNYAAWARQSKVSLPPQTITVKHGEVARACGSRPGTVWACAIRWPHNVMRIQPGASRFTFYHELGHFFDFAYMTERWRDKFARIVGRPHRTWDMYWWHIQYGIYNYGLREPFAEIYAHCAGAGRRVPWKTRWLVVTRAEARRVCRNVVVPAADEREWAA